MASELVCRLVRPDRLLYEGPVGSLVLVTPTGELGVWPGHAPEIVALGDGVVRLRRRDQDGGQVWRVVVSGGYAEITPREVIILAAHARRADDIDPAQVVATREQAISQRDALDEGDHRRAYYDNKVSWCNLLLGNIEGNSGAGPR